MQLHCRCRHAIGARDQQQRVAARAASRPGRHTNSHAALSTALPAPLKRGLTMLCQMLSHGAPGASISGQAASQQVDPMLLQQQHNMNGHAFIKVVGVGGGGGNAINRMISSGLQGVEFWAVNTDAQALESHPSPNKLQLGAALTRGLGTGGKPALGEQAAQESVAELGRVVAGADLLFITAGMGGGTGTGAAPVIARLAKDAGILTIGVVTHPFMFEGRRRAQQALEGIETLRRNVDTLIVIPNDRLLDAVGATTPLQEAFQLADDVLRQGVQGISDIVTIPGLINVDFADVKAVMFNSGTAMLGVGVAAGKNRAEEAALAATSAPLIQCSIERATGIVYNITGGSSLTLSEVNTISEIVTSMADPSCNIIFGAVVSDASCAQDEVRVTLIATGFSQAYEDQLLAPRGGVAAGPGAMQQQPAPPQAQQQPPAQQPWRPTRGSSPSFRGRTLL